MNQLTNGNIIYDADGVKHRQQVYEGGQLTKITDYIGELIFEDSLLAYIHHEEGRIVPTPAVLNTNTTIRITWVIFA